MKIWIDPSELRTNSLLPPFNMDNAQCDGLEALTGCDFIVSSFPLPPNESTLPSHISSGAIFCQRKSGYDFIGNFEQLDREIARIQACKIPMSQVFILAIGQYKRDDDGLLRITGKRPLENNRTIKYDTLLALESKCRHSGCNVIRLNDESEIELWIESELRERETIKSRGNKKELYPPKNATLYEPEDNFFQDIIEIPPDDIRSALACGFPNLGPGRVQTIMDYASQFGVDSWGVYYLKLMTDEDENGKAIYDIKGIGDKMRTQWRNILGLPRGYNLGVREIAIDRERSFKEGIKMAMLMLADLVKRGHSSNDAYQAVLNFDYEFYDEDIGNEKR